MLFALVDLKAKKVHDEKINSKEQTYNYLVEIIHVDLQDLGKEFYLFIFPSFTGT